MLQEKTIEPLGSNKPIQVDVRILCATHKNLLSLIEEGQFRQDLYYRLTGALIQLPALRNRKSDIPFLSNHFLKMQLPQAKFSDGARNVLQAHLWPGNVRELEQVISRAALLNENGLIESSDLEIQEINLPQEDALFSWNERGFFG